MLVKLPGHGVLSYFSKFCIVAVDYTAKPSSDYAGPSSVPDFKTPLTSTLNPRQKAQKPAAYKYKTVEPFFGGWHCFAYRV